MNDTQPQKTHNPPSIKNLLALLGLIIVVIVGFYAAILLSFPILSFVLGPHENYENMVSVAEHSVPLLSKLSVTKYFDRDWCRKLVVDGTFYAEHLGDTNKFSEASCLSLLGKPKGIPFDSNGNSVFDQVKGELEGKFMLVEIEYRDGIAANAVFGRNLFSDIDYIYHPGYVLPVDEPGEKRFEAINSNWYVKYEDWN